MIRKISTAKFFKHFFHVAVYVIVQSPGRQARADYCLVLTTRFHRQLKAVLRARCSGAAWLEHFPWVLLGLRAAPKEEAGVSAAEATYGHSLVLPSQLQPPPRALQAFLPKWSSPAR